MVCRGGLDRLGAAGQRHLDANRYFSALVEICVGVVGGNFLGLDPKAEWISFLAGFGAILLTFLAGAEIEPEVLRKYGKESIGIRLSQLLVTFLGRHGLRILRSEVDARCRDDLRHSPFNHFCCRSLCGNGANRLNREELGKLILAACFVTDLGPWSPWDLFCPL